MASPFRTDAESLSQLVSCNGLAVFGTVRGVGVLRLGQQFVRCRLGVVFGLVLVVLDGRDVERFGLASEYGQVRQQAEHGGRYGSDQDDDHPRDGEHLGGDQVPDGVADSDSPIAMIAFQRAKRRARSVAVEPDSQTRVAVMA